MSSTDAWAVGEYCVSDCYGQEPTNTLVLHWNGTNWARVKSPNPGHFNRLSAVSAVSATDVWAVGKYFTPGGDPITLTLHWDGTRWSKVGSPSPPSDWVVLEGVSAVSATDAWAVGYYDGDIYRTLILHWDGRSWRIV